MYRIVPPKNPLFQPLDRTHMVNLLTVHLFILLTTHLFNLLIVHLFNLLSTTCSTCWPPTCSTCWPPTYSTCWKPGRPGQPVDHRTTLDINNNNNSNNNKVFVKQCLFPVVCTPAGEEGQGHYHLLDIRINHIIHHYCQTFETQSATASNYFS